MKKLSLLVALIVVLGVLTACGAPAPSPSSADSLNPAPSEQSSSSATSSASAEPSESAAASASVSADDREYLSWGASDWEAASDEEKKACTKALLSYVMADMGIDLSTLEGSAAEQIDSQVDILVASLDTSIPNMPDTMKIKDLAEIVKQVIGGSDSE